MKVNVYEEELPDERRTKFVKKTAQTSNEFCGVSIFLKSAKALHDTETDDDRSAVTFWGEPKRVAALLREAADEIEAGRD